MTDTPAPDWGVIRRRYEETQDRIQDICREEGVVRSLFETVRKREQWRRRNPRPFPPLRRPADPQIVGTASAPALAGVVPMALAADAEIDAVADRSRPAEGGQQIAARLLATPAARRRLLDRLVAAISMKLEQLERRMTDDLAAGEDATATDHEREARAIGALIDNLGKITEIETGLANVAGKSGSATSATSSDLADEADRCRRELAERLHRIVEAAQGSA